MRKQVFGRQFSRTKNQRQALFRGLVGSLIEKGEIVTTLPKAKAVKSQAERLVTKAKRGSLMDKRVIFRFLPKRALVNRLTEGIAPLFKEKKGGYLRIVRLGMRRGDAAEMAKLSFVADLNRIGGKPKREKKTEIDLSANVPQAKQAKEEKKVSVKKPRKIK